MVNIAKNKFNCPNCGAEVNLPTLNATVTTCRHCDSLLSLTDDKIESLGIKSFVLKDTSNIVIGSTSKFKDKSFTVIGRYQVGYSLGFWNEWYILFDNGTTGWLTDTDNGSYLTIEVAEANYDFIKDNLSIVITNEIYDNLPNSFDDVNIDHLYKVFGKTFLSVDKSENNIVGIEGTVDFYFQKVKKRRAVDLRTQNFFYTADYTDNLRKNYIGVYQESNFIFDIKKSKDDIEIEKIISATELKSITCPSCGNTNQKILPEATKMYCSSCGSEIINNLGALTYNSLSNKIVRNKQKYWLDDKFKIDGKIFTCIGLVRQVNTDNDEDRTRWTSVNYYLVDDSDINNTKWFTESQYDYKYYLSVKSNICPNFTNNNLIYSNVEIQNKDVDYTSYVEAVAGTFRWEVSLDDRLKTTEYNYSSRISLVKEVYEAKEAHSEVVFTLSRQVEITPIEVSSQVVYQISLISNTVLNIENDTDELFLGNQYKTTMLYTVLYSAMFGLVFMPLFFNVIAIIIGMCIAMYAITSDVGDLIKRWMYFLLIIVVFLIFSIISPSVNHGSGSSYGGSGYSGSSGSYSGGGHK